MVYRLHTAVNIASIFTSAFAIPCAMPGKVANEKYNTDAAGNAVKDYDLLTVAALSFCCGAPTPAKRLRVHEHIV
ncbi:MAG: hypothetical protein ABW007_27755 [Chitinophagaceae bacterium]